MNRLLKKELTFNNDILSPQPVLGKHSFILEEEKRIALNAQTLKRFLKK